MRHGTRLDPDELSELHRLVRDAEDGESLLAARQDLLWAVDMAYRLHLCEDRVLELRGALKNAYVLLRDR